MNRRAFTADEIVDIGERLKEHGCLMCRGAPSAVGVYVPKDPVGDGLGAPAHGKVRCIAYTLCKSCLDRQTQAIGEGRDEVAEAIKRSM